METKTLDELLNLGENKERRMYNTLNALFSKIERASTKKGRMSLERLIPVALTYGENINIRFNNKTIGVHIEGEKRLILKGEQKDLEELITVILSRTKAHQEPCMN